MLKQQNYKKKGILEIATKSEMQESMINIH